jgi:ATP phosphoribosyltransferase
MTIAVNKIEQLVEHRKKGFSVPELSRMFALPKSTVLRYVKNVEILPEYYQRWLNRRNASQIISERQQVLAKNKASWLVGQINDQSLALIAAALYWAEGAKKDFSLTNSDPEMIRVFVLILKKVFKIKDEEIKISIRLYDDLIIEDAIKFWSGIVGVDLHNNVSINILNGEKKGKLKFGMCRVRVKKAGLLFKTIFAINKQVCDSISS